MIKKEQFYTRIKKSDISTTVGTDKFKCIIQYKRFKAFSSSIEVLYSGLGSSLKSRTIIIHAIDILPYILFYALISASRKKESTWRWSGTIEGEVEGSYSWEKWTGFQEQIPWFKYIMSL